MSTYFLTQRRIKLLDIVKFVSGINNYSFFTTQLVKFKEVDLNKLVDNEYPTDLNSINRFVYNFLDSILTIGCLVD